MVPLCKNDDSPKPFLRNNSETCIFLEKPPALFSFFFGGGGSHVFSGPIFGSILGCVFGPKSHQKSGCKIRPRAVPGPPRRAGVRNPRVYPSIYLSFCQSICLSCPSGINLSDFFHGRFEIACFLSSHQPVGLSLLARASGFCWIFFCFERLLGAPFFHVFRDQFRDRFADGFGEVFSWILGPFVHDFFINFASAFGCVFSILFPRAVSGKQ